MPNPMMNAMGAGAAASSPTTAIGMFNPAGRQMPAQAVANAQGQPFQPGGKFNPVTTMPINPMQQAMAQPMPPQGMPQMPNGFPSQAMAPNAMPQGFMQHAAPQMNPQTLAFLQSLFARR